MIVRVIIIIIITTIQRRRVDQAIPVSRRLQLLGLVLVRVIVIIVIVFVLITAILRRRRAWSYLLRLLFGGSYRGVTSFRAVCAMADGKNC
jgi:L-asparagine transporter-like permease